MASDNTIAPSVSFINIRQVTHTWSNETLRRQSDHDDHDQLRACFYRGEVFGDPHSTVSVSLCNGMVSS